MVANKEKLNILASPVKLLFVSTLSFIINLLRCEACTTPPELLEIRQFIINPMLYVPNEMIASVKNKISSKNKN